MRIYGDTCRNDAMFTTRTVGLVGHGVFAGTNYHVDISPRDAEVKQPEQVNARQRTSTLVNARRFGRPDGAWSAPVHALRLRLCGRPRDATRFRTAIARV